MDPKFAQEALHYHQLPVPGKWKMVPSKPLRNPRDVALAYAPGMAVACQSIMDNPEEVWNLTNRGNLVAVITNGTAILGLGAIGSLAGKPVMEAKAVFLKHFADVDAIDLEIEERDPQAFIETVARLASTFGAIHLEDIRSPECFDIEQQLSERLDIPVFHDDQHGTAIVAAAGVLNGLKLAQKSIENVKCVVSGAGASAIATLNLLCGLGMKCENIFVFDASGFIHTGRENLHRTKQAYAQNVADMTLVEALKDADIFIGLSAPNVLSPENLHIMARDPLIFALANPVPEIMPDVAAQTRSDAIVASGRGDFPNQINNILAFPYLFRGALDVRASKMHGNMMLACAKAMADILHQKKMENCDLTYQYELSRQTLIPSVMDPRLRIELPFAVAQEAVRLGLARVELDIQNYKNILMHRLLNASMA